VGAYAAAVFTLGVREAQTVRALVGSQLGRLRRAGE
jgi:hypothetical protein